MIEKPHWVVVAAPASTDLTQGQQLPFEGVAGRQADAELRLQLGTVARSHCRFSLVGATPIVEDLGSTNGVFVNGQRINRRHELQPGDFLELPWGLVLQLSGAAPLRVEWGHPLVEVIFSAPEEPQAWKVWADCLLEQANPLGERVARPAGGAQADDARALGPLGRVYLEGTLEIEWRHGFIRRAVLRQNDEWTPGNWLWQWQQLLCNPLGAFVEELEVDALSFGRRLDRADRENTEAHIVTSLTHLAAAAPLRLLRSVKFGPSPRPLWSPQMEQPWRACVAVHPRLREGPIWVARAAGLQLLTTPAGVSVRGMEIGTHLLLTDDAANLIGPTPECRFALDAAPHLPSALVALRVDRDNGVWFAQDLAAGQRRDGLVLQVNGRPRSRQRLRPGDRLEPAPGLLFRFVME